VLEVLAGYPIGPRARGEVADDPPVLRGGERTAGEGRHAVGTVPGCPGPRGELGPEVRVGHLLAMGPHRELGE
jgi:hypothetical protein